MADLVVDSIDVGGAGALLFLTAASAEVARLPFANPAFGAAVGPVATANAITSDTDADGGVIASFKMVDGTDSDAGFAGNVQVSGGDINLADLTIAAGETVSITSLTYTAAP
jgi:hypothetical protein